MTTTRRGAALLAAAAAALAAVPLGLAPATAQAQPTHVAIVVAGEGRACVSWHSGMTGADVLDTAFTVTWGQQSPYIGFVLQIDGHGTLHPDDEHYWSYWRDTGGGWSYSGRGSAGTTVTPGTVEGWSYVDGQSSASAPANASYDAICAGKDPSPTPTRHRSTTPAPHPPSTRAGHTRASSTPPARAPATTHHHRAPAETSAAATTAAARPPRATTSATTDRPHPSHSASRTDPPSATKSSSPAAGASAAGVPTSPDTPAPDPAGSGTPAPHAASEHTAALPSWTTALALLVVLAVGTTATVRIRGSRR